MQKEGNLTNTQVLLTTLKGYEKLMNADEREKFYKMIENFSYAESTLNHLEEELDQRMTDFEDSQVHVAKTFEFIMKKFDEFIKKYDEMSKNVIETTPKKEKGDTDGDQYKCDSTCDCKSDLTNFKKFLNSNEANEIISALFETFKEGINK